MGKLLIILGIVAIIAGLLWPWLSKLPFGQMPGDIAVRKENYSFYFPITTMIIVSAVISALMWLFNR
ncbi:DUF2905 domain-containing protein [Pseudomonas sp. Marseille-QA0892]